MRRAGPLMLAGTCRRCGTSRSVQAPEGKDGGRPRLTHSEPCGAAGCDELVRFTRPPRTAAAAAPPAPDPPRRVRKYRDPKPEPVDEAPPVDVDPGPVDPGPGGHAGLGSGPASDDGASDGEPKREPPGVTDQRPEQRRRARLARGPYPGIVP